MLISGKAYWAKLGNPVASKFKEGVNQWSFDLAIDEKTKEVLLKAGVPVNSIRNKGDERGDFVTFSRGDKRVDGTPGKPYEIIDHHGEPWEFGKLIGNGSTLNVSVTLNEREYRGKKFLKPSAIKIQVWDLQEFKRSEFPIREASDFVQPEETSKDW